MSDKVPPPPPEPPELQPPASAQGAVSSSPLEDTDPKEPAAAPLKDTDPKPAAGSATPPLAAVARPEDTGVAEPMARTPGPRLVRTTTLPPGQLLEGRFRIRRLLGKGAMGVVYLADDQVLGGQPVVLKLMTARGAAAAEDMELFRREVLSARSVIHPNVVRVFDYHVLAGAPSITMEYMPGGTLDDLRKQNPPVVRWLHILADVAEALQAVHAAGIIHRDLKPQNILLGEDGRPRVTDFGIARSAASDEDSTASYTPMYAAPEQIRRQALNTRTDIYAFGAMGFHLLSGQPPFPRDALLEGHLKHPPPSLLALVPGLPREVEQLIHRCMDKEARRRPDAETLARQLREAAMALEPSRDAAVLRVDLVAFPSWYTQQHQGALHAFTDVLAECPDVKAASRSELLKVPLSDGVVLVFLHSASAAYRTATRLVRGLAENDLAARVGLHHGSVKMVADLNLHQGAVGGGIRTCERISSCGDEGHILASDRFREVLLAEQPGLKGFFHGPYEVTDRLGGQHTVWNIRDEGMGREFVPPAPPRKPGPPRAAVVGLGAAAVFAVAVGGLALGTRLPATAPPATITPVPAPVPPPPVQPAPTATTTPTPTTPVPAPEPATPTPPRSAPPPRPRKSATAPAPRPAPAATTPAPTVAAPAPAPAPAAPAAPAPEPAAARPPPAPAMDAATAARAALQEANQAMRTGDFQGAVARAEAALKLDPTQSSAHKLLGMAHGRLRHYCDSKRHYQAYLTLNPTADNAPGVRKALEAKDYAACP